MATYTINVPVANGNFVFPEESVVYGFTALSQIGAGVTTGDVMIVSDDTTEKKAKEDTKNKNYSKKTDCSIYNMGDAMKKSGDLKEQKVKGG